MTKLNTTDKRNVEGIKKELEVMGIYAVVTKEYSSGILAVAHFDDTKDYKVIEKELGIKIMVIRNCR